MLADPDLARVHHVRDLRSECPSFEIGDIGHLLAPRAQPDRDERTDTMPEPGVDHAGHVPGAGEGPLADGGGHCLTGIQAGEFGGAHGAP